MNLLGARMSFREGKQKRTWRLHGLQALHEESTPVDTTESDTISAEKSNVASAEKGPGIAVQNNPSDESARLSLLHEEETWVRRNTSITSLLG